MLERARAAAQRLTRRQRSGPAARRRGDGAPADAHTIQAHFASLIEVQRALISSHNHTMCHVVSQCCYGLVLPNISKIILQRPTHGGPPQAGLTVPSAHCCHQQSVIWHSRIKEI